MIASVQRHDTWNSSDPNNIRAYLLISYWIPRVYRLPDVSQITLPITWVLSVVTVPSHRVRE